MAHFRNGQDLPMILVGTQDNISERNPRVIDDSRARKLANDLKRCSYYETCATYGLNVERVFQDACQKILQQRIPIPNSVPSRPTTPQGTRLGIASYHHNSNNHNNTNVNTNTNGFSSSTSSVQSAVSTGNLTLPHRNHVLSTSSHHIPMRMSADFAHNEQQQQQQIQHGMATQKSWQQPQQISQPAPPHTQRELMMMTNENNNITKYNPGQPGSVSGQQQQQQTHNMPRQSSGSKLQSTENLAPLSLVPMREHKDNNSGGSRAGGSKNLPTPTSTPTTSRKSRRRSNLFIPSSSKKGDKDLKNGELGSGRSIPIKQGYLYKRSSKSLNKEWKKKYVTLCNDGRLTYHSSLQDYMNEVHGKEIPLQYVTVKVPGQKPRGSKSIITNSALTSSIMSNGKTHNHANGGSLSEGIGCLSIVKDNKKLTEKVLLTAFDTLRDPAVKSNSSQQTSGDEGIAMSNSNSQTYIAGNECNGAQRDSLPVNAANKLESQIQNVKKRHRRIKSSSVKANDVDDSEGYEFFIVSLESKTWHFEAANSEERDEWVAAIEQEIFKSLQSIESTKTKPATTNELASMVAIRNRVPGNSHCVDCDALNPEWASLNLGVLMCIECSGVHRNLGSHISKVRSLGLDDWPPSHLSVMLAIGNSLANSVWEANTKNRSRPKPNSSREEKEAWIRSKYEAKEFLAQCNMNSNKPPGQQLIEAVIKSDIKSIITILARATKEVTNAYVNSRDIRTPLLWACATGNLAIAQLLIWNGANIKQNDNEGRTSLAYARAAQSLAKAKSLQATAAAASTNNVSNTNTNSSTTSSSSSSASASGHNAIDSVTTGGVTVTDGGLTGTTGTATTTNGGIPVPHYSIEDTTALVELLISLGCPESAPLTASGTLPRRRDTLGATTTTYEKAAAGVV